jgi:hypothetical protein
LGKRKLDGMIYTDQHSLFQVHSLLFLLKLYN